MKTATSLEGGVIAVDLSGRITGEERETMFFHGSIQENLSLGKRDFVIDMKEVEWINSIGMGMLIAGHTSVRKQGGRFILCNIEKVESILSITRLIKVFEHCGSRQEALWLFSEHHGGH